MNLQIDWCTHKAAKYAVENWHYSKCMPVGKLVKIGVWEDKKFIGCIIFSRGACPNIGKSYKLEQTSICELTRVALRKHETNVSKILKIAMSLLKMNFDIELIVSYADMNQNHCGIIYQAGNWIYVGRIKDDRWICILGKTMHRKSAFSRYGTCAIDYLHKYVDQKAHYVQMKKKHKYLYPLTKEMRKQIEPLAKPYPKQLIAGEPKLETDSNTIREIGGANPTHPLYETELIKG